MAIDNDVLKTLKPERLDAVRARIRDGDVLLCSGKDPFSRLISWATQSPWTHVALACRWPGLHRIVVFEAVQHIGVRAVTIERFVSQSSSGVKPYPGRIVLARHDGYAAKGAVGMRRLADFAADRLGDRFNPGEALKIAARIAFDRTGRAMPKFLGPKDEFICSEYVARCLHAAGLDIPWDGRGFIAPADFAGDPQIHALAQIRTR